VPSAHVGVGQDDVTFREAADDQRFGAQGDPPAVGQDELGQIAPVAALVHVGGHGEPPRLQVGPLEHFDLDGPHEGIALYAGMLAGGVGELARQRIDEVRESGDVGGR
jgi:hypothetical protein